MKYIYRRTPVSLYDTQALESWLEELALKGLYVKKLRSAFSSFERGEPRPTRYRAEPLRTSGPSVPKPMVELYREFGWELVTEAQDSFLLFSTQDPDAPEPHTDPELQGELWRKLYKLQRRRLFVWLLSAVSLHVVFLLEASMSRFASSVAILLAAPVLLVGWTCAIFNMALEWADLRHMARVVRQLEAGEPLDHQAVRPKPLRLNIAQLCANLVILTMLAGLILGNYIGGRMRPLEKLSGFPALSLAELEGEGYTPQPIWINMRYDSETHQFVYQDYGNYFRRDWYSPFSVEWYVSQYGNTAQGDRVSLDIELCDLMTPFFSTFAAQELLNAEKGAEDWTVSEVPCKDIPFLVLARHTDGTQLLAASRGDKALLVRYTGRQELMEHLDKIAEMLA